MVGTIASQMGEIDRRGRSEGQDLAIWFNFQGQNGPMAIEMAGTVDGDTVKGTMASAGTRRRLGRDARQGRRSREDRRDPRRRLRRRPRPRNRHSTGDLERHGRAAEHDGEPDHVLKQDGEKLTGDYVSAQYGKFPITGTLKGADVSFSFAMNIEGNGLNVTYTGTVEKDGASRARSPTAT